MGELVAKKDTHSQCWARLRLENGDQVLISVAQSGVKIFKMKWAGLVPGATLWASQSIVQVGRIFFSSDDPHQRPLDCIIEKIIDCRSAADVCDVIHKLELNNSFTYQR